MADIQLRIRAEGNQAQLEIQTLRREIAQLQQGLGQSQRAADGAGNEIGELHETMFLGSSLKKEDDATLFLELALRGYDLSRLRNEDEPTGEVVRIG